MSERVSSAPAVPQRILVVDDNKDAAETLGMALTAHHHIVEVFLDPVDALAAVEEFHPSIALLDINMPGMNGYELARAIRKIDGLEHIKIIAVTGYGRTEDKMMSRDAGFDHHFVKPTDFQDILKVLNDYA